MLCHLTLEFDIVRLCRINRRNGKDRIEPIQLDLALFLGSLLVLCHFCNIGQLGERIEPIVAFGLLVEVVKNIRDNFRDTLRGKQSRLRIDALHLLVLCAVLAFYRVDVINAERQYISVIDSIHDGIGM